MDRRHHPSNTRRALVALGTTCALTLPLALGAASHSEDLMQPVEGDHVIENFGFHTGETIPEMVVHYRTIGDPGGAPMLILHGTTGNGDGMRAAFPRYNYVDMVKAQHAMLTEDLGIDRLRVIVGNSMGGMLAWTWAVEYPGYMDAIVPMASLPAAMSGRNWMMRRMVIDAVRTDPAWMNGDYEEQPPNLRTQSAWFGLATSGGNQALQAAGATREAADKVVDDKLANQKVGDANDTMYRRDASRDFDPSGELGEIEAHVLVINSADDERNPPELGILEREMPKVANAQVYIIPGSPETRGHGTTGGRSALWADRLAEFLASVPEGP